MRNKAIGESGRKVQKIFLNKWVIKKKERKKKHTHHHSDTANAFQLISLNKCANDTSQIICQRHSERQK